MGSPESIILPVPADVVVADLAERIRPNARKQLAVATAMTEPDGFDLATAGPKRFPPRDALAAVRRLAARLGYVVETVPLGPRGGQRHVVLGRNVSVGSVPAPLVELGRWAKGPSQKWRAWMLRALVEDRARFAALSELAESFPGVLELASPPGEPTPSWSVLDHGELTGWVDELAVLVAAVTA